MKINRKYKLIIVLMILAFMQIALFNTIILVSEANDLEKVKKEKTIEDGIYIIRSAINDKYVLDVTGPSKVDGTNIQLFEYADVDQQRFRVKYLGDGYYSIISLYSEKSLDVAGGGKIAGTNIQQYQSNNTDAQKWVIVQNSDKTYSIVSKCNGLYVDVEGSKAQSKTNIQMYTGNGTIAQKFKFELVKNENNDGGSVIQGSKTIEDGIYSIESGISSNYVLDVQGGSRENCANVQLYRKQSANRQKFNVKYLGNGYYTIMVVHSNKVLDVEEGGTKSGSNIQQYESNNTDAQKWVIKQAGGGYYYIISKKSGLYLDVACALAQNGSNIQLYTGNGTVAQKFKFIEPVNILDSINTTKYPGYKEKIEALTKAHPGWNFELLYTGLRLDQAVAGEAALHSRNLVPKNYKGDWICPVCGTKLYDSGWYCASEKAISYYMDPRNFLDETNVFQFQDVNEYIDGVCTLSGIQTKVNGTFLQNYATAIDNACRNQNVNSYYIIARVLQEQGTKGTQIGTGMNGGDGKTYYNPFNIGASGNGYDQIYANALATAKSRGWDSMQKALEGGITFCKNNWLENYQNTLYQNKFDIDSRNGTPLYTHQYMQNLMAADSEGKTLRNMYANTNKLESNFTFIIPMYEGMGGSSTIPTNTQETLPINVQITANGGLRLRKEASTDSQELRIIEQGSIILSVQRGINSNWHKVITKDGVIGYMSGTYLKQVSDETNCNYIARVKTADGSGCNVRVGPSTNLDVVTALADGVSVTVINQGTYNNINNYNWYRVQLSDGRQGFMPANYLVR